MITKEITIPTYSVIEKKDYLTFSDIVEFCKNRQIEFIDLKFIDLPDLWQHYTLTIEPVS